MNDLVLQGFSIAGALLILSAYLANQRAWLSSRALLYLWANFIGALLLAVVAIVDRRVGFILLEGLWACVSMWSIVAPKKVSQARPGA